MQRSRLLHGLFDSQRRRRIGLRDCLLSDTEDKIRRRLEIEVNGKDYAPVFEKIGFPGGKNMLCVIAKLSDAATRALTEIRNAALPDGLAAKPLYGHITLAAFTKPEEARFIRSCREILDGFPPFKAAYVGIEILEATSIIAAIPEKSGPLDALHRRIAEKYPEALDRWTQGDSWRPHTTLFYAPQADLHGICRRMNTVFSPFPADIRRIEFSRVTETGYEILDRVDLSPVRDCDDA